LSIQIQRKKQKHTRIITCGCESSAPIL
jgi:hypothetical protein